MTLNRSAKRIEGERHDRAAGARQVHDDRAVAGNQVPNGETAGVDGFLDERGSRRTDFVSVMTRPLPSAQRGAHPMQFGHDLLADQLQARQHGVVWQRVDGAEGDLESAHSQNLVDVLDAAQHGLGAAVQRRAHHHRRCHRRIDLNVLRHAAERRADLRHRHHHVGRSAVEDAHQSAPAERLHRLVGLGVGRW